MEENKSHVLVTGGSGLVGSALRWAIEQSDPLLGRQQGERWTFISTSDGDLRKYEEAENIFQKHRPDKIIHLAARVGGLYKNTAEPAEFLTDNLMIDQNVLHLSKKYQVQKVVSCLSTCVFPDQVQLPIDETMIHDGPPHESNFGYAYAKRMTDVANKAYAKQFRCNFTSVIPTNVYGPHDNFREGCHFIPSLIKKLHEAKRNGDGTVQLEGSGRALRQFIYSRDLARLMLWVLRNYDEITPIILSVDEADEISIHDTVHLAAQTADFKGKIEWDFTKSDGQLRKTACNAKLKRLIDDFAFTSLQKGLAETYKWYESSRASD